MHESRLGAMFRRLTAENGSLGYVPFAWQMRLLRRFIDSDLPAAIDVPTGLGKTSVMALWIIALGEGTRLPRRLVYVVDRRAVVDQATRIAEQLRANLPADLAERVGLGHDDVNRRLPISTLRGGFVDNRDWLEDPSKPAVIVGTVDMIGSRLLFEGYGVSRRRGMRSFQAGLLGVDTLVLLDEAHLCPPFESLLRRIEHGQHNELGPANAAASRAAPQFRLISLSATGRTTTEASGMDVFRLIDEDRREGIVHQRLAARKRIRLIELEDPGKLTEHLAEHAIVRGHLRQGSPSPGREPLPLFDLADVPASRRILVYCDSRATALKVKALIDKGLASGTSDPECRGASELLVGERRLYERNAVEKWLMGRGFLGAAASSLTFLVATSAGEVGVDLDADHMVCDLVSYERMVQRLGRVNRRGGAGREALIDVIAARPQEPSATASNKVKEAHEGTNAVFEARLAALLRLPVGPDGRHDGSPAAVAKLKSEHPDTVRRATTPAPLYPALTRPLVDAWSMTSLKAHEGRPAVGPWLRGWDEQEEPETTVAWRAYLPRTIANGGTFAAPRSLVDAFFQCAPLHPTEKLEARRSHVLAWLLKRTRRVARRTEQHDLAMGKTEIAALVLDRASEYVSTLTLEDLWLLARSPTTLTPTEKRKQREQRAEIERALAGTLLVVDARFGGLSDDGMLDEQHDSAAVTADADDRWQDTYEDQGSDVPVIRFRVVPVAKDADGEGLRLPPNLERWRHVGTFETEFSDDGGVRAGLAVLKWRDDAANDGARSVLSSPQVLRGHAEQVADRVRAIAERLRLPADEIEALVIAAQCHDDGKAAPRWQQAMNAPVQGRPYAKTSGGGDWRLLAGYAHEFGSLVAAAQRRDLPEATRDLILHLIAAHHGHARPLIPPAGCEDGPPSLLEAIAGSAALRFSRLQDRYGPWGLAWREAILRAADQGASRDWSRQASKTAR